MADNLLKLEYLELAEQLENRRKKRMLPRKNLFQEFDDIEFHRRFRLNKQTTTQLLSLIEDKLQPNSQLNNALTPMDQLLIALRFYATGAFQIVIADLAHVSQSTASRAIKCVSEAIASLRADYIKMPQTEEECLQISEAFYKIGQFPGVVGCLDCTHIPISSPGGNDAERFRNRKGYFSLNVQTVVSADLQIRHVVARWPGSAHDSTILQNSSIPRLFDIDVNLQKYHLLGDSGYACNTFLMTPLSSPINRPKSFL